MQTTLDALPSGASAVVTALHSTGAQRRRMAEVRRVKAAAIDADLHFFAFFTSSIRGFCSLRL